MFLQPATSNTICFLCGLLHQPRLDATAGVEAAPATMDTYNFVFSLWAFQLLSDFLPPQGVHAVPHAPQCRGCGGCGTDGRPQDTHGDATDNCAEHLFPGCTTLKLPQRPCHYGLASTTNATGEAGASLLQSLCCTIGLQKSSRTPFYWCPALRSHKRFLRWWLPIGFQRLCG